MRNLVLSVQCLSGKKESSANLCIRAGVKQDENGTKSLSIEVRMLGLCLAGCPDCPAERAETKAGSFPLGQITYAILTPLLAGSRIKPHTG